MSKGKSKKVSAPICPGCRRQMFQAISEMGEDGWGCGALPTPKCVKFVKAPAKKDDTDYSDLTDVAAGVVAGAYKVAGVGRTTVLAWLDKLALCAEDTATPQSLALAKSLREKMKTL